MTTQAHEGQQVLIVEDEPKIARLVADYLEGSGFATHHLDHGDSVLPWLTEGRQAGQGPDLVLLDLMLPGTDGLTLCRELRQRWPSLPVIMLTARVEEIDRLLGLELGADDYICKPYSPREVVARVKAVLRRLAPAPATAQTQPLELDEERLIARLQGQPLALTLIEFQLLKLMAAQPGRVFSREQLMDLIYPDHRVVSDRTIDSHVKKLRQKLKAAAPNQEFIQSVYGAGYKFEA